MLKETVQEAINNQINAEIYSAHLYLSMSAWLETQGLSGFAHWMKIQYQEELTHAMKFFDYVNERNGRVILGAVEAVPVDFAGVIEVFEKTLEHEQSVTGMIDELMSVAEKANDRASQSFLQWFIDEQVEEEATVSEILDNLRLIDGQGNGMFMMNRELASRTFSDPTAE